MNGTNQTKEGYRGRKPASKKLLVRLAYNRCGSIDALVLIIVFRSRYTRHIFCPVCHHTSVLSCGCITALVLIIVFRSRYICHFLSSVSRRRMCRRISDHHALELILCHVFGVCHVFGPSCHVTGCELSSPSKPRQLSGICP